MNAPVDATLGHALNILERLIAFDTESSRSNLPLIAFVENWLAQHGIASIRVPDISGTKAALFATIGPAIDGGIVLSGHTDCVPVAGQEWSSDPFVMRRDGTRLYGRGTCDMKGFDAICLAMIPEFKAANLKRPIHLLLSYDEEVTCEGSLDAIRRFGHDLPRPAMTIVGEPTTMLVADAHKSIATYYTSVRGHEAHSATLGLGVSAVHVACELVGEIVRIGAALAADGDPSQRFVPACSTVHVGTIAGGTARNIMARDCKFHWEFRGLPGVPIRTALDRFQSFADSLAAQRFAGFPDCYIKTDIEVEVPGLAAQTGSAAESLVLKLARQNRTIAVPYATEAGQFQINNIETIVCGPGHIDQAHQRDEFIEVAQIEECIAFMRRLAAELS